MLETLKQLFILEGKYAALVLATRRHYGPKYNAKLAAVTATLGPLIQNALTTAAGALAADITTAAGVEVYADETAGKCRAPLGVSPIGGPPGPEQYYETALAAYWRTVEGSADDIENELTALLTVVNAALASGDIPRGFAVLAEMVRVAGQARYNGLGGACYYSGAESVNYAKVNESYKAGAPAITWALGAFWDKGLEAMLRARRYHIPSEIKGEFQFERGA
jgi:hypothetical protein